MRTTVFANTTIMDLVQSYGLSAVLMGLAESMDYERNADSPLFPAAYEDDGTVKYISESDETHVITRLRELAKFALDDKGH